MNALALDIGPVAFAAARVTAWSGITGTRRLPTPAHAVWESCRELLLDVSGDDEIAVVGIACAGPIHHAAGLIAPAGIDSWRHGFALADAVRRMFPAAAVEIAADCHCLRLAERNTSARVDADMILAGAAILTRTAGRSRASAASCSGGGLGIARVGTGQRPSWHITCRHHEQE